MKTVDEAARLLGVTPRRVRALIGSGRLTAEKVGGIWLVDDACLERRLNDNVRKRGGRPKRGSGANEIQLVLMNRNHVVAEAVYDTAHSVFIKVGPLVDKDRAPLGLTDARGRMSPAALSAWWSDRGIPRARKGISDLLARCGASVPEELAYRNLGLSLSDQYWVRPSATDVTWDELNFFQNDFEQLAAPPYAGDCGGAPAPRATSSSDGNRHPDNTSDGVLPKHWFVAPGGTRILAKGGGPFSQEPCNEVIASELCQRIVPPNPQGHARFVTYKLGAWPDEPVPSTSPLASLCANFLSDEEEFVPAQYVRMVRPQEAHHSDHQHYLECCHALGVSDAARELSFGIVCDDIMANSDRHWRNFGVVRNVETLECRIAPIFDTGSSLWHDRPDLLAERDFTFVGKQFESHPGRQLQLAELDWVDTGALQGLDEYARETLSHSTLPPERIDLVCQGIRWRVGRITNICEFL